ncbi:MAG: hypothetical protein JW821_17470 [Deltaproteobacteria bacterium]|nr:hypothetical protein [Deltaproteobacteria bacterium]
MKPPEQYRKHIYWLREEEAISLQGELKERGQAARIARGVVCTPLDERNRISIVPPSVWGETCSRQGSWYRQSDRNPLFLVVSSFGLDSFEEKKEAVITRSDFQPLRQATAEEKAMLVQDPDFAKCIPPEWNRVGEIEKKTYLRWAAKFGSHTTEYDFLFLSHTANHANFLRPRFYIEDQKGPIPYSIDRTAHLCSCCLELFQVLGREHVRKLVRPCPGAALFSRLQPDRYLLVEKP